MSLFWELHGPAGGPIQLSGGNDGEGSSRVQVLETRLEKAMMISEALWIIIREKLDLTDEVLEKAVKAVDLQDGKLDGRVTREIITCAGCGRNIGRNRTVCIYCGSEMSGDVFR